MPALHHHLSPRRPVTRLALLAVLMAAPLLTGTASGAAARAATNDCTRAEAATRARNADALAASIEGCLATPDLDAEQRGFFMRARAWLQFERGQPAKALSELEAAFQAQPAQDYEDFIAHGVYLRALERWDEALAAFDRARQLDHQSQRDSAMTEYNIGVTYARMNRPADAIEAFGRALAAQPGLTMAWWRRGLANEALGRKDAARSDFQQFARRMPSLDRKRIADDDLQAWKEKLQEYGIALLPRA